METINVGNQITKFRKEKGYSMRELAKLANISPSMLSQIERGLANPSIQTLKELAGTLDIPVFYFFLEQTPTDSLIIRKNEHRRMNVNGLSYELLSPDLAGDLETVIMTVPKGVTSSEALVGHKGEEIAYILQGDVHLYLDTQFYELSAGDSVKIPAYMAHKWENIEDLEAKIIFSVTPPSF